MAEQALSDLKVIDLTHYVAGPYCTKLMADFGAEVIKIEKPGSGDGARHLAPFAGDEPHPEKSLHYLYLNTNKKSVTLNLKDEAGKQILKELVKDADVLVENFRPGVMERLGLDYASLFKVNPHLVMTSITNFGQTGPYRDFEATTLVNYAMSGYMNVTGDRDKEPLKGAGSVSEYQGGLHGLGATMMALFARDNVGEGQHVDVSIMEAYSCMRQYGLSVWAHMGVLKKRNGVRWDCLHPLTILPCKDGHVAVTTATIPQWETIKLLIDEPGLHDERFNSGGQRLRYADEVDALMQPWMDEHTGEEIFETAQELRLPFGMVPTIPDLLGNRHMADRNYFVEVDHPVAGKAVYPGAPFRLEEADWKAGRAPLLGEHNEEILGGRLGYSRAQLEQLEAQGTIGTRQEQVLVADR